MSPRCVRFSEKAQENVQMFFLYLHETGYIRAYHRLSCESDVSHAKVLTSVNILILKHANDKHSLSSTVVKMQRQNIVPNIPLEHDMKHTKLMKDERTKTSEKVNPSKNSSFVLIFPGFFSQL